MSGDKPVQPEDPYRWKVRLHERQPGKTFGIFVAAIGAGTIGALLFQPPILGIVGFLAILGATAEFWTPVQYVISDKQASARCGFSLSAIEWSDIKRVLVSEEGVKLSPLEESGRMSPFRGVFLRFDGNKDDVLNRIREKVGQDVRFLE